MGTLAEILMAFLFVLIIILLRYFVDITTYPDQNSFSNPVLGVFDLANSSNRSLIYYHPNNSFIQEIVTDAYNLINAQSPNFTATRIFFII